MKILHLDPFAGVSGDMFLGALMGCGVPLEVLAAAVEAVAPGEAELSAAPVTRGGLAGTRCTVRIIHDRERSLPEMKEAVRRAPLDTAVKDLALAVLARLGEAEAKVHGLAGEAHLHELGSTDTLADVAGTAAGVVHLGIERVTCGPVNVGAGFVKCAHGLLPVPPPATAGMLSGANIFSRGPEFELATPTGAALLSTLVSFFPGGGYGPLPPMTVTTIGLGAGTSEFPGFPNLFRVFLGDSPAVLSAEALAKAEALPSSGAKEEPAFAKASAGSSPDGDEAVILEVGLDDVSPEYLAPLSDALHAKGAREVHLIPAATKKGRMGVLVRVLAPPPAREELVAALLEQTGSPGVRWYPVSRLTLPRETATVETPFGPVRVKAWRTPAGRVRGKPEFEDCAAAARRAGVTAIEVREAAMAAFLASGTKPPIQPG
jgi:uncharacterized protein (TIGR00299 family) protein